MITYKEQEVPTTELLCPVCGDEGPIGLEYTRGIYNDRFDWLCSRCGYREDRLSGKELRG